MLFMDSFNLPSLASGGSMDFGWIEGNLGPPSTGSSTPDPDFFAIEPTPDGVAGEAMPRLLREGVYSMTTWAEIEGDASSGTVQLSNALGSTWHIGAEQSAPFPVSDRSSLITISETFILFEADLGALVGATLLNKTDAEVEVGYAASLLTLVAAF